MNLSKNWLADFVDVSDINDKAYCDRMTDTGSKVEGYEVLGEDIENVLVARITKIAPHENSDHLQIGQVDIGKETVQIYANDKASSYITPAKTIVGYKKIEVKPMSEATAVIEIPASRLAFYDKYGKLTLEPGDFEIMACSNASDVHFSQTVTVEGAKVAAKETTTSVEANAVAASLISIEIMARDIQATVVEGVKIMVDSKVVATTSADGSCTAKIPAGAKIRFTKEGYETIERTVSTSGRIDLTMTPSF